MAQKINTGNYENRDFHVSVEMQKEPDQSFADVVKYGKELCAKEVGDYYREIKHQLMSPSDTPPEITLEADKALYKRITLCLNDSDLRDLEQEINITTDDKVKAVLMKAFNKKLIELDD